MIQRAKLSIELLVNVRDYNMVLIFYNSSSRLPEDEIK